MVKAVGYRILVKDEKVEEFSKGGIAIVTDPRLEQERASRAKVLDIGETAFKAFRTVNENGKEVNGYCPIKIGDIIHYAPYAGKTLPDKSDEGGWLRIITDDDVMGVEK